MVDAFSSGKGHFTKPSNGSDVGTWDVPVNGNMDIADACMSGTTSLTLSNANVTLTQSQMQVQRILCTGTLTANVAISFLAGVPGNFIIDNRTTGSFSISVITSAPGSTGITSPQNYRSFVFTDGTNVVLSDDGSQIPQPNSITNSQLAQIPSNTFKGNISVATANPSDIPLSTIALSLGSFLPIGPTVVGLVIKNSVSTPNTGISVTANLAVIPQASGLLPVYRTSVSVAISTGASGVNGLDVGVLQANSWYHIYLIDNGTTTSGLMSLSATSPTLPAGYNNYIRIGAMRTDGSQLLYRTLQRGAKTQYVVTASTNTAAMPTAASGSSGNVSTPTWTAVSLTSVAPTTATRIFGVCFNQGGAVMAAPNNQYGAYNSTTNPPPVLFSSLGSYASCQFDFVVETTSIYYASNVAGASIMIFGWIDSVPSC